MAHPAFPGYPREAGTPRTAGDPTYQLLQRMLDLGCHLLPLRPGEKRAAGSGWPNAAPLGVEEARAHLDSGRNLGVNLGRSGMVCVDSENALATAALLEAGFIPTVIPAKAQLTAADIDFAVHGHKQGGAHFWMLVPPGIDPLELHKTTVIPLPGGGVVDALAGKGAYAVAPPSRIIEAQRYTYAPAQGGPLDLSLTNPPRLQVAPAWLFEATVEGVAA